MESHRKLNVHSIGLYWHIAYKLTLPAAIMFHGISASNEVMFKARIVSCYINFWTYKLMIYRPNN
jgi:hypothetical protein